MCGIFGVIPEKYCYEDIKKLAHLSRRRGKDSSGLIFSSGDSTKTIRYDGHIDFLLKKTPKNVEYMFGHTRLITNGESDNQPAMHDDIIVLHNGIIINYDDLYLEYGLEKYSELDTQVIPCLISNFIMKDCDNSFNEQKIKDFLIDNLQGAYNLIIVFPKIGKVMLLSNTGDLFASKKNNNIYFASEEYFLKSINAEDILNVNFAIYDIPKVSSSCKEEDFTKERNNLIFSLTKSSELAKHINHPDTSKLKRCSKCILPETMPYISFNKDGECNYCQNYVPKNVNHDPSIFRKRLEKYRKNNSADCIIPFSGGRDSCYTLHLAVKELGLNPVTYTYDWGMVTDLARRNISRFTSQLGVKNILIAADIEKKRSNVRKNVLAWLKNPHLGMISIFTAGDKHFFQHIDTVKNELDISLNIWGINPLETTHFKAGFLGVPPSFADTQVYISSNQKQLQYQTLRFKQMLKSPRYFNSSIIDTISGEYYRSFNKKKDYFHAFDFYKWDEENVNNIIKNEYGFEKAIDTSSTWRIGDGTAAFYNYIYYNVAGLTEFDTFRSNQIREGDLSREKALSLVEDENRPRLENLVWYLDILNLDPLEVIKKINKIPRLYA